MANTIEQRIKLSGEKEYNAAIKEAQRNLRTLQSELKAETAELGNNATAQQKAETRAKSLRQQIAEQEKIVHTLREALEKAKTEYSDNEEVIAKWEQKLNNARTSLANMKNDLEGVGSGFKTVNTDAAQATVATKSVADAMSNLSQVGESVSSAIEGIFTSLLSSMADVVEKLWDMITDTAAKANRWTDLAGYFGSSAQDMQMWSRSIEAAGGSFDSFISVVSRLAFGGNEKKITELLGISKENYQDDVQYALAILDELERRRDELSKRDFDDLMSQVFGAKRAQDVMWLLNNAHNENGNGWRDNPEQYNGETGLYGMTDEELGTMNDLYVKVCAIEEKWDAIKDKFAAGLGNVALNLLVNVEGALDGIAEYMNATDQSGRDAALAKIRQNMEEFFRKLGEIIRECVGILRGVGEELRQSDDPVTRAIGDILTSLSNALEWIVNNADKVKTAFETIFGIWLIAKLSAVGLKLASIVSQIQLVKTFSLTGAGAGAAAAAAGGAAAGGGAATAAAAGSGALGGGGLAWTLLSRGATLLMLYPFVEGILSGKINPAQDISDAWDATLAGAGAFKQHMGDILSGKEALFSEKNKDLSKKAIGRLGSTLRGTPMDYIFYPKAPGTDIQYDPNAEPISTAGWNYGPEDFLRYQAEGDSVLERIAAENEATGAMAELTEALRGITEGSEAFGLMDATWWQNQGTGESNGITGADLRNFNGLPAMIASAAQSGVAAGVSGLKVEMDGSTVGWIVAPYVSEMIARDMA